MCLLGGRGCSAGRSTGEGAKLLAFKFNELLFAVHFDDQWDNEDEESGASNPRSFSCGE